MKTLALFLLSVPLWALSNAVTITVNPIFASIVGALAVGEKIGLNLIIGLAAVTIGIWIATVSAPAPAG